MKFSFARFLIRYGLISSKPAMRYRIRTWNDGALTVDRMHWFRWQRLGIGRASMVLRWGGNRAYRFPDLGQAKDGILRANTYALISREARRLKQSFTFDLSEIKTAEPPAPAEPERRPAILKP